MKSEKSFSVILDLIKQFREYNSTKLDRLISEIYDRYIAGGKVFLFGNGGSASDCTHIANELILKYKHLRRPFPAISLSSNISTISAASNDGIYDDVFSRQILALGNKYDTAIGFSVSGISKNIEIGLLESKKLGLLTVSFTGPSDISRLNFTDYHFPVECTDPGRVQEVHMICMHVLSSSIEQELMK